MKIVFFIGFLSLIFSCQQQEDEKYIFFLHNRFLEEHRLNEPHPKYGKVEYVTILEKFKAAGFTVISEQRKGNVNAQDYAIKIAKQIDSLLDKGVSPESITVVGTSKGGYIAQYVSTIAANPNLNFVFIASFMDDDIERIPNINYCGNILTIYEKSDPYGVSAFERKQTSTQEIKHFKEIELNTKMGHGFLFKPLEVWINPTIQWGLGNYATINTTDVIYKSKKLEVTQLDEGLFLHKSFLKQYHNYPCNGAVYINNGEAVVFDSPTDDSTSIELINWIKNDLGCHIKAIIINHFHIDCLGGLAEFHKSDIPSYANEMTVELASSEKAHHDIVPQISFNDSLKIKVGDSYVENRYFGAGHSPDNIVSFIKDKEALFGGCLIKADGAKKGSLTDADLEQWSNTVRKVKQYYADELKCVIPGHGNSRGVELLDYTIHLFEIKD